VGVDAADQHPAHRGKRIDKKPIGNNLDGYNLRRHKLRKKSAGNFIKRTKQLWLIEWKKCI
jgi:hypothetical protein